MVLERKNLSGFQSLLPAFSHSAHLQTTLPGITCKIGSSPTRHLTPIDACMFILSFEVSPVSSSHSVQPILIYIDNRREGLYNEEETTRLGE